MLDAKHLNIVPAKMYVLVDARLHDSKYDLKLIQDLRLTINWLKLR